MTISWISNEIVNDIQWNFELFSMKTIFDIQLHDFRYPMNLIWHQSKVGGKTLSDLPLISIVAQTLPSPHIFIEFSLYTFSFISQTLPSQYTLTLNSLVALWHSVERTHTHAHTHTHTLAHTHSLTHTRTHAHTLFGRGPLVVHAHTLIWQVNKTNLEITTQEFFNDFAQQLTRKNIFPSFLAKETHRRDIHWPKEIYNS